MSREDGPIAADMVELAGVWFSSLGVPRAAGQMFGYLLACDPAEQSASEIAEGIGISRASVSSSARKRAIKQRSVARFTILRSGSSAAAW